MALWIIAIVLIIVFFPILLGVATTAAMIIIPLALMAFTIFSIVHFAKESVTNLKLGRLVGLGITIFHIFFQLSPVRRWMYAHNNGIFYSLAPILTAYAVCLLMLARNRGVGGKKGIYGIGLLLLGALFLIAIEIVKSGSYFYLTPEILFYLIPILGYALLMTVPAHSETSADEKNGVLLITWGFLVNEVYAMLEVLYFVTEGAGASAIMSMMTLTRYGSLLLLIEGTVLCARSMLSSGKSKEK